ncbi:MAG TPA: AEC family transporter [Xanthobacteraceae bacterium]|nr:AEC family transporter [Xanthobacteraceae bacterium]
MSAVFAALIPIFLLIVMGFALRRWLIAQDTHWVGLEQLLYYVMFPALLIGTMARADLTTVPVLAVGGTMLASVLLMTALCFALKPALTRFLRADGPAFSSLFQGATRWQTFVALPLAGNLFGDLGLAIASVAIIAMTPVLNILCVSVLVRYASSTAADWRVVLGAIVRNPLIWSCVVGAALNPVNAFVPPPVHVVIDALGRSSLALGLLIVGAGLRIDDMTRFRPLTLPTCALKLVLMPAIAIGIALALGLSGANLAVIACCTAVPAASNSYVLARQLGGDAPLMAQIITVETMLAAITMPVAIAFVT